MTTVCSGLVLQADQQAPKGCHQLQGPRSCSDFHAGTLSALLQTKPCRLEVEPRFNSQQVKSKYKLQSTSHSETAIKVGGNGKTRYSKLVHIYYIVNSMLPQTPVFFMNANAPPPQEPNKTKNMNKKKQRKW